MTGAFWLAMDKMSQDGAHPAEVLKLFGINPGIPATLGLARILLRVRSYPPVSIDTCLPCRPHPFLRERRP
jgi:hypothetical protein